MPFLEQALSVHYIYLKRKIFVDGIPNKAVQVYVKTKNGGSTVLDLFTAMLFSSGIDPKAKVDGKVVFPLTVMTSTVAVEAVKNYLYRSKDVRNLTDTGLCDFVELAFVCKLPKLKDELFKVGFDELVRRLQDFKIPFNYQQLTLILDDKIIFSDEQRQILEKLIVAYYLNENKIQSNGSIILCKDIGVLDTHGNDLTAIQRIVYRLMEKHLTTLVVEDSDTPSLRYFSMLPYDPSTIIKHISFEGSFINTKALQNLTHVFPNLQMISLTRVTEQNAAEILTMFSDKIKGSIPVNIANINKQLNMEDGMVNYFELPVDAVVSAKHVIVVGQNVAFKIQRVLTSDEKLRLLVANPNYKLVYDSLHQYQVLCLSR
jgi:hypothetical protein